MRRPQFLRLKPPPYSSYTILDKIGSVWCGLVWQGTNVVAFTQVTNLSLNKLHISVLIQVYLFFNEEEGTKFSFQLNRHQPSPGQKLVFVSGLHKFSHSDDFAMLTVMTVNNFSSVHKTWGSVPSLSFSRKSLLVTAF